MKNTKTNGAKKRGLLTIAIVMVIGFSMAACGGLIDDGDGGGGGSGGNGSLGSTLTITNAQVYSMDYENGTYQLTEFAGTVPNLNYVMGSYGDSTSLNELIEGNPAVTLINGKLNVKLGKPKTTSLQDLDTLEMPSGVTVSTKGVKIFMIQGFYNDTTEENYNAAVYQSQTDSSQRFMSMVTYWYVNKDVNIRGTYSSGDEEYTMTATYAMSLKAGWNSLFQTYSETTGAVNFNLKTGTPPANYKWVVSQSNYGGGDDGGDDNGDDGSLGNTLTIANAQVYSEDWDYMNETPQYTVFNGTVQNLKYVREYTSGEIVAKSLNDLIEGNPTITLTNGKLNITLGKPKASSLQDFDTGSMPPGITVSTTGVKTFSIQNIFNGTDPWDNVTSISQGYHTADGFCIVQYIYSNKDVNINGTFFSGDMTITLAINLKAGWNSVIQTQSDSGLFTRTGTPTADYKWIVNQTGNNGGGDDRDTPTATDFDFDNMTQTAGSVTGVIITPKDGKSGGAITIYYDGSTTLPTENGEYTVTFDVAAATGWDEAIGLSAGTLTITES